MQDELLPEHCHYRDEGCELSPSCLDCPLPWCIYDEPRGRQHQVKDFRDREILRLFHNGAGSVSELAQRFGVSRRTVQRVLSKKKGTGISAN